MNKLAYFPRPLSTLAPRDLLLVESLPVRPTDTVLEVGTGSGSSLLRLAGSVAALHGVDVCEGPVERIRRSLAKRGAAAERVQLLVLDFCGPEAWARLPARYDVIFSCDTLEHVPDARAFFVNTYQALKPGGSVFITFPNEHPSHAHGITYFERRAALESLLTDAGFARDRVQISTLRMNGVAEKILTAGWTLPRQFAKRILRFFRGRNASQGLPQTFEQTDFFTVGERFEPLAPLINAYCWAVMQGMRLSRRVYQLLPAPDIIWDTRILIRASRQE